MVLEFLEVAVHNILSVSLAALAVVACMTALCVVCGCRWNMFAIGCGAPVRYHRCVYPASLFDRRRKYNVAVRMSRHPELNDYVFDARTGPPVFLHRTALSSYGVHVSCLYVSRY